ncbi:MAG: DUF1015 family protein [Defluviitaleaceae bacterium]|nr:DUF1015 family protein [Defluviitaleaceae bacterium]
MSGITIKPFKAVRPKPELAHAVASLPYDVMNTQEARMIVADNPNSFLHVDRAEIDLSEDIDPYSPEVYAKAKENLASLTENAMLQDSKPNLYVYRLTSYGHTQTGLVTCVSTAESEQIKKHEFTRPDKEQDRINHMLACAAHTSPVLLAYRTKDSTQPTIIISEFIQKQSPVYDFTAEDGVRHEVWVVSNTETQDALIQSFAKIPNIYIADGHHRNAAALKVAIERNKRYHNPEAEHNFYLAVIFPDTDLEILDYNRVVKDLNGMTPLVFLESLNESWQVEATTSQVKPTKKHVVGMYLKGQWYKLTLKNQLFSRDIIETLDCTILQNHLLAPLLGISDPRIDKRIDFVGGIRGLEELEIRVDSGEMTVAFALYPTSMQELIAVTDANQVMPPKSTWFEPKLRSGLFVHLF